MYTKNKDKRAGYYWHVYHSELVSYCWDYDERADYIRRKKSPKEIKTRLRLFKQVKCWLPISTWDSKNLIYSTFNDANIKALHKKECPNCPWDGKTIFPKWYRRVIIYISHLLKS